MEMLAIHLTEMVGGSAVNLTGKYSAESHTSHADPAKLSVIIARKMKGRGPQFQKPNPGPEWPT